MTYHEKYSGVRQVGQTLNLCPAVAIGGPPHSGKSVLAYSLTQTLRERGIDHYLLRAYPPDGEGDWFLESEPPYVRHFRIKGARSEAWLPTLKADVKRRHLPLLVDMGGLPTVEQETILDACTHAILLTRDAASRAEWSARIERHGLVLLADLDSDLAGSNRLSEVHPLIRGTLAGLERGARATGAPFDALVELLVDRFGQATIGARRRHLESAPVELTVDLRRLASRLTVDPQAWAPEDLCRVLAYLPQGKALGLYGRGPNWLYAALAVHTRPADFYLFDIRYGWIVPPALYLGTIAGSAPWQLHAQCISEGVLWTFRLPDAYLDLDDLVSLTLPSWPHEGLILSGKLPNWLWSALARAYDGPWLAILQPQLAGAVVIHSGGSSRIVGEVIPVRISGG